MFQQDPITLYSQDGKSRSIPAIDASGWINAGWQLTPPAPPASIASKPKSKAVTNARISIPENSDS